MQPAGTPKLTEQSADVLPKRLLTRLKSIASDMVPTELPTPADTAGIGGRAGSDSDWRRVTAFSLRLSRRGRSGRQPPVDYVWRQFMVERLHGLAAHGRKAHGRNQYSASEICPPDAVKGSDAG